MTDNANIGADINCVSGLDPLFTLVTGRTALAQAIARRLQTPRGTLAWIGDTADYGYDVRQHLGDDLTPRLQSLIASRVEAEALADERVRAATATVTLLAGTLRIALQISDAAGPFRLTLSIDAVTVTALQVQ
jgi:hypothetical protein